MAIDTTIHRDAEGLAMLTADQAEALARFWDGSDGGVLELLVDAGLIDNGGTDLCDGATEREAVGLSALARYVLATAPIVRAAVAQADAATDDTYDRHPAWIAWSRAAHHTEAAVRAWREAVTP